MKKIILFIFFAVTISSCSLIDIDPDNVVSSEKAFDNVEYYQQALTKVYYDMTVPTNNISATDYATDDFTNVIQGYAPMNYFIYLWDYQSRPQPSLWTTQYQMIARTNVIIDNYEVVPANNDREQVIKDQVYAQAEALRAFFFFNLTEIYAPHYDGFNGNKLAIPLKLKLDREYLPQSTLDEVFDQIDKDLSDAEAKLKGFTSSTADAPYVFGLDAVKALKARIALYKGDLQTASDYSKDFTNIELLDSADYWMLWADQFGSKNKEVIFMTHNLSDTDQGTLIDYHNQYETNNVMIDQDFYRNMDANDIRRGSQYIDPTTRRPLKYLYVADQNNATETRMLNYKYFRLAEQYLIYAEANLSSNKSEALKVFNKLRVARGEAEVTESNFDKHFILSERRKEFFQEGLRFYDLKRLSKELNLVVKRNSGAQLAPGDAKYTFDIPIEETNSNPYINE
ncbi:RagB/SusD family nutrient uptake outer membrane protein [Flammeovirga sp. MY04]|uniref:RagB/SusD family nutrient uptake outer membrane protein n=1 Tax=Flammeovirga sp. MY04 TaxID=1191459 RepID=UPI000806098D|nr:RagB/SusD family nutrient uptake outer membrane protein [Flammeovirga sp. MY04]ANQ47464.1 RagB/SusD family nutrient uptake outer membrane protein [Flammeovirga sp. MY04]